MGLVPDRERLMRQVNEAFDAAHIEETARRLKPLLEIDADVFELLGELGFLAYVTATDVATYRRNLPIPPLHKRVLTLAFRDALLFRRPLKFTITSKGKSESIQVTESDRLIDVDLIRID
jgi:hypothetical protein